MKKNIMLILVILFSIYFTSCDGLDGGLFYSILEESEILDGNLENKISVGSMLKYVDSSREYYFIAAGNIYYRSANTDDIPNWVICSPFESREDSKDNLATTFNMIVANNYLYGIFLSNDKTFVVKRAQLSYSIIENATNQAVSVKEDDDNDINKISFAFDWNDFTLNAFDSTNEVIIDMYTSGSLIFFVTENKDASSTDGLRKYNLYSSDSDSFSSASVLNTIATDLANGGELQVDYDSDSSIYWIVFGNKIFSTNGTANGTDETSEILSAASNAIGNNSIYFKNNGFRSILSTEVDASAAGREIFLTSKEGFLFKKVDGSWSVVKSDYDEDYGLFFDSLFGVRRVTYKNDTKNIDVILIGSEKGYYEIQAGTNSDGSVISASSDLNTSLTLYNQFLSIDLSEKVVQDFYFDDDNGIVFSLGFLSGLWSNKFDSKYWNAE